MSYYLEAKKISKNSYKTKNSLIKGIEKVKQLYLEAEKKEINTRDTSEHTDAVFDMCDVREVLSSMQTALYEW